MDQSTILSPKEFYKKFSAEEGEKSYHISYDIFKEIDVGKDVGEQKKKKVIASIPIDSAIKEPPSTHEELTKFLREHLQISNSKLISVEDQHDLADVLTWAIMSAWPEHRKQGPDPFLSSIGNKELRRRIAVSICQTAEELFYEYVAKAEKSNEQAVFSTAANLTRLKTQLLHEAHTCLNVLKVRRRLVSNMRDVPDDQLFQQGKPKDNVTLYPDFAPLDAKAMSQLENVHQQFGKKQLVEIKEHMQSIRTTASSTFIDLKNEIQENIDLGTQKKITEDEEIASDKDEECLEEEEEILGDSFDSPIIIRHSSSMPNLQADDDLSVEFSELHALQRKRTQSFSKLVDNITSNNDRIKDGHQPIPQISLNDVPSKSEVDEQFEGMEDDLSPLLQVGGLQPKRKKRVVQSVVQEPDPDDDLLIDPNLKDQVEGGEQLAALAHLPQPAIINVKVPNMGIVRICDASVSPRVNQSELTLKKYPTIYNEFLGEIDDATVKSIDEHLFAGKEAQEVYDEITKTMSKDFLLFDKDDFVEPCAPVDQDMTSSFMSSILQERQKSHILSDELKLDVTAPWNDFKPDESAKPLPQTSLQEEWKNSPKFGGLGREEILMLHANQKENNEMYGIHKGFKEKDNEAYGMNKSFTLSPNKCTTQSTSHIQKACSAWLSWYKSHMDCDDYKKFLCRKENDYLCQLFHLYDSEDSEDDEQENLHLKEMETKQLEEQRKRKEEIRKQKKHFREGFWNTQCVSLGGLGKDPELDEKGDEHVEEKSEKYVCLQERLERTWKLLRTPEKGRLDMAMKYSNEGGTERLTQAIEYWEKVVDYIIERENLVHSLEDFERLASDPNRFFVKGPRGSSVARINEGKARDKLVKSIKSLDENIKPLLAVLEKEFGDIVTYQGRVYQQKLQSDRVEMLYWLQQERRQQVLNSLDSVPTVKT